MSLSKPVQAMRVKRLFVFMNAVVLALANLAVPFGLAALPYYDIVHLLYACLCATAVFVLASSDNRWRFPWWVSVLLAVVVVFLGGWFEGIDFSAATAAHIDTKGMLPVIYLILAVQTLQLVKLTARQITEDRIDVDFWIEHGVGLAFVLFACFVCKEAAFCVLLLFYIGAAAVGLMAFHFRARQDAETVRRLHVSVRPLLAPTLEPVGRLRPRGVLFWGLIVVPLVLLLFLFIPRPDFVWGRSWSGVEPFANSMDLNRTGKVWLGTDPAFTVAVADANGNAAQIYSDQRWRGEVFTDYQQGRWYPARKDSLIAGGPVALPDLGPGRLTLIYEVNANQAGGLFLAEPVQLGRDARGEVPPVSFGTPMYSNPAAYDQGTATLTTAAAGGRCYYKQAVPRPDDRDRMPASAAFQVDSLPPPTSVPQGIRIYTATLLHDLADQHFYGLIDSDLDDESEHDQSPRVSVRGERIAVAFADYLRLSRDFNYNLYRPRYDKKIDPTEDFLVNVRLGHCERFASGLALMLRSQGVPARVVVGYRGCQPQGNGAYVVQQNTAHAWVEALVPPKSTAAVGGAVGAPGCEYWLTHGARPEWRALDPTAPYYPPMPKPSSNWLSALWTAIGNWLSNLFKGWNFNFKSWNFNLISFDGNMQADLFSWLAENLPSLLIVVLALLVLVYLARFALPWLGVARTETGPSEPFYKRLLDMLAWYRGLEPQPGQTPREFAAAAGQVLEAEPKARHVATLPAWIIELYYRVRFGHLPLVEKEKADVEARLEELKSGLKER
jgi:transglutaminase-like putative cysteine protease